MQTKRILNRFLAACVSLVLLVTSCEIQENFKYEPSDVDGVLGVTAWEFIQANSEFDQLESAITRTGLQSLYQDEERTFIVPNNKAFNAYLQSGDYSSIEDIPVPILRNMLRYHIVKDRVIFTDPAIASDFPIAYEAENGQTMFLSRNNNYIGQINQGTARQWEIRTSNLEPTNGVIHAVDFIVYFSAPSIDDGNEFISETDTIYPLHDSFVAGYTTGDEDFRYTNYGTNILLRPKSVNGTGTYDRNAYLMFDFDDFEKPGIVVDMQLKLEILHARGGYTLDLYKVPDNNWTETGITFDNAPPREGDRIAFVQTQQTLTSGAFNFDLMSFYQNESPSGKASFSLEAQFGSDGVDEFASKEHTTREAPMIIATLVTNQSVLVLETNEQITVSNGGSVVIHTDFLEISGADAADIIYTVETAPTKGWLIRGADIIGQGGEFVQTDLQSLSLIYIHDGESTGEDAIVLSARDRTGAVLEDIAVKIDIQ